MNWLCCQTAGVPIIPDGLIHAAITALPLYFSVCSWMIFHINSSHSDSGSRSRPRGPSGAVTLLQLCQRRFWLSNLPNRRATGAQLSVWRTAAGSQFKRLRGGRISREVIWTQQWLTWPAALASSFRPLTCRWDPAIPRCPGTIRKIMRDNTVRWSGRPSLLLQIVW